MKKALVFAVMVLCLGAAPIARAQDETAQPAEALPEGLQSLPQRAGYAIGFNMGTNMLQQEVDIDLEAMIRGLRDGLGDAAAALTDEQLQATMQEFQQQMVAKQQEMQEMALSENKAAGDAFREDNAAKEGVQTTESGIQYEVLEAGEGAKPTASDQVTVHYKGTLVDGTQFDSSYERGQPATFQVGGVVKGWQEVLQMMPAGSKWRVVIPPDLAYGDRGSPPRIGPGSTLVFEIELLSIGGGDEGGEPKS